jgi:hypothetical protein
MSTGGAPTISNELARTSLLEYSFTTDTSALLHQFKIYAIDKLGQVISTIYYSGSGYQDLTEKIVLIGSSAEQAGECFTGTTGNSTKIHVEDIKKAVGAVGDFVTNQDANDFTNALKNYIQNEVFIRTKYPVVKTPGILPQNSSSAMSKTQAHVFFSWSARLQNITVTSETLSAPIESGTVLYIYKNGDLLLSLTPTTGDNRYSWTNPGGTAYDFAASEYLTMFYGKPGGGSNYAYVTVYAIPLFD